MTENKKKQLINAENESGGKKANHCCENIKEVERLINETRTILDDDIEITKDISWWSYTSKLNERTRKIKGAIEFLNNDAKRKIYECNCKEERDKEKEQKGKLVNTLKTNLEQARKNEWIDGLSVTSISGKEEKLDRLVNRLINDDEVNINREEIENLRNAYGELFQSRIDRDDRKMRNEFNNVRRIKRRISEGLRIKDDDLQRIYELCESIAKSQLEIEERFEAKIEVPLHQI